MFIVFCMCIIALVFGVLCIIVLCDRDALSYSLYYCPLCHEYFVLLSFETEMLRPVV